MKKAGNSWSQKRQQITSLQSLRALAFLDIFLSHCEIFPTATVGVSIFVIMSGFLMAYQYYDREMGYDVGGSIHFAYRKVKKLYPLHIATLVFVAGVQLIKGLVNSRGISISSILAFFANFFSLQSWVPSRSVYFSFNAVSWYLSTIIFSYCLFAIVWEKIKNKGRKTLAIIALMDILILSLTSLILYYLVSREVCTDDIFHWVTYVNPIYRFGDFLIGVLVGVCFVNLESEKNRDREGSFLIDTFFEISVIAIITILILLYSKDIIPSEIKFSLVWVPTSTALIWLISAESGGGAASTEEKQDDEISWRYKRRMLFDSFNHC